MYGRLFTTLGWAFGCAALLVATRAAHAQFAPPGDGIEPTIFFGNTPTPTPQPDFPCTDCCGHWVGCTFIFEVCDHNTGGCVVSGQLTIDCATVCEALNECMKAQCNQGQNPVCCSVQGFTVCVPINCPAGMHRTGCKDGSLGDNGCGEPIGVCPGDLPCKCAGVEAICEPDVPGDTPTPTPTVTPTSTPDGPRPPPTPTPVVTVTVTAGAEIFLLQ